MRKLTYDIFDRNGSFVKNVASYGQAQEAKHNGFTVKEKMVEMVERLFFDCYKGDKLVKTVVLNKNRNEAKEQGFKIKNRLEWVEV